MKSDIEIAESVTLQPIGEIAQALDITEYETYGRYKAKVAPKKTRAKARRPPPSGLPTA